MRRMSLADGISKKEIRKLLQVKDTYQVMCTFKVSRDLQKLSLRCALIRTEHAPVHYGPCIFTRS